MKPNLIIKKVVNPNFPPRSTASTSHMAGMLRHRQAIASHHLHQGEAPGTCMARAVNISNGHFVPCMEFAIEVPQKVHSPPNKKPLNFINN